MLLSLLSKRSLTVESRDAYGFSVRPQNLQRYKEYTNIYKSENHTSDIQATNDIEKKVVTSDLNEEEPVPLGAKRKAVQTWAEIRPSLGALDYMMSFRVKKNKITKNEHMITGKHPLRAIPELS
ncbi:hypothetical protein Leryth_009726 [Lithospermum erythrorhizon]|nr:hypothetical protein Leryth_009726 [Lithospermum erythrorhizon]